MATLTSTGVGSGLDVNGLVTQLVAADRAPQDARLTRIDTKLTTAFTALSQLKGSMASFQSALTSLKDSTALLTRSASLSDGTNLSASAGSNAVAGTYDVEIVQLAKAGQLNSAPLAGGPTTVVGAGTLTLSMGGKSFDVTIDSTNNTLAGIRDAINGAAANAGVRATLLTGVDGSRLILTGSDTGATNALKVSAAGGDGGLAALTYDPAAQTNSLTQIQAAQDAVVNIAGFAVHSATNTVDSAIDGVTLTLKNKAPGTIVTLTVANDNGAIQNKVNSFVSAYNTLKGQITTLGGYNASSKTAGPMLGDPMLLNIDAQLRRIMGAPVVGTSVPYTTLANLGITAGVDGTLSLDSTKFQAALTASPGAVSAVFGGVNGVATQLYTAVDAHIATGGDISTRDGTLSTQRKDLTAQKTALDDRMTVVQARYLKQFNALDSLLTQMNSTANYLTQQLATSTTIAKGAGK